MSQPLITDFFITRKCNSIKKGSNVISNESIKASLSDDDAAATQAIPKPPDIHQQPSNSQEENFVKPFHKLHKDLSHLFRSLPNTIPCKVKQDPPRRTFPTLPKFDFEKKGSIVGSPVILIQQHSTPSHKEHINIPTEVDKPFKYTQEFLKCHDGPYIKEESKNLDVHSEPNGLVEEVVREESKVSVSCQKDSSLKPEEDSLGLLTEAKPLSCPEPLENKGMVNVTTEVPSPHSSFEKKTLKSEEIGAGACAKLTTKEEALFCSKSITKDDSLSCAKPLTKEEENGIPDVLLDSLLKESDDPIPFLQQINRPFLQTPSNILRSPRKPSSRKQIEDTVDLLCDETIHDTILSEDTPSKKTEATQDKDKDTVFKVPLIPKPKPSPSSKGSPLKTPFLSPIKKRLSFSPGSPKYTSPSKPAHASPTPKSPQSPNNTTTIRFVRNSPSSSLSRNYSRSFLSKASYSILNSLTSSKTSPKLPSSPSRPSPTSPVSTGPRRLFSSPQSSPVSRRASCSSPRSPFPGSPGTSRIRKTLFPSLEPEAASPHISPMKRPSSLRPSEFQSPNKKNKVAEVQSQLRTCSSLSQLQQRLVNLQGFKEDLESMRTSSPIKLHLNSTPTKQHTPIRISSPVLSRKKKSFLDRINDSIEKHKRSPIKSAPKLDGTPKKIFYSPTKAKLRQLVEDLEEVAPTLELPLHYRRLEEMFHATDTVVGLCLDRGEPCSFPRLQASVQTLIHGKFEKVDLGRIKTVYPLAYVFTEEKLRDQSQLFIAPNFPPGSGATKLDVKTLLWRRRHFHLSLVPYIAIAHEEFLRELGQSLLPLSRLTHWHPKFPVAEVGDIPPSPLLSSQQEPEQELTFEFRATLPDSGRDLAGIPSSLLSKVRAKEAARALRIMQRSPEEQRELKLLEGLHKLVPILYNFLLMERKTSMWMDEVCRRVSESNDDFSDIALVEEHLQYLVRVLPHWLRMLPISGGGQCLKCVDPKGGLPPLVDLLEHLTVVERTYFS